MPLPRFLRRFDNTNMRLRIISSVILVPCVLFAVWVGGIVYGAMIAATMMLGLYEWLNMVTPQARPQTIGSAFSLMLFMMAGGLLFSVAFGALLGVVSTMILFVLFVHDNDDRAGWAALGIPYMGGSGLALLALRAIPGYGMHYVFYLLATVWATDVGAFIAGRIIGGPKLAPFISPGKTWAGLAGGVVLATICGYFTTVFLGARNPSLALFLSPLLAIMAQGGDLFESYFKRRAGLKESGDIIPGHGGILDRIDGLVVAGIFAYLFQSALGEKIFFW